MENEAYIISFVIIFVIYPCKFNNQKPTVYFFCGIERTLWFLLRTIQTKKR